MDALDLVVKAIGWTLIHSIWLGALAAAAYSIPAARLRIRAPQSAYAWGLSCLLALVVMLLLTFVHEFDRVRSSADTQAIAAAYAALPVPISGSDVTPIPAAETRLVSLIEPILPLLVLLWAAAVLVIGSGLARSQWALRRLVTAGVAIPQLADAVLELSRHFGVSRSIAVVSSAVARAPFVIGHFSPVIVLPLTVATGMPWPQLRLILAHEIAHLRRADYLVNWLQIALEVLLFFHPAVRWLSEELRRLREACCDDMVVAYAGGRGDYTRALLSLEESRHDAPLLAPSAVAGGLLWRVQRIAGRVPNDRSALQRIVLPALFLSLTATLVGGGMQIRPGAGPRDLKLPQVDLVDGLLGRSVAGNLRYDWQLQLPALLKAEAAPMVAPPPAAAITPSNPAPVLLAMAAPAAQPSAAAPLAPLADRVVPAATSYAAAEPVFAPPPKFPARRRLNGATLDLELGFSLDAAGTVIGIETLTAPADSAEFVQAATSALANWRYTAATASELAGKRLRHRFVFRDENQVNGDLGDCTMVPGTRVCVVGAGPTRSAQAAAPAHRCATTTGSRMCRR